MILFDTGAFNEITKAYCEMAIRNIEGINEETKNDAVNDVRWLFDTYNSSDILKATNRYL